MKKNKYGVDIEELRKTYVTLDGGNARDLLEDLKIIQADMTASISNPRGDATLLNGGQLVGALNKLGYIILMLEGGQYGIEVPDARAELSEAAVNMPF